MSDEQTSTQRTQTAGGATNPGTSMQERGADGRYSAAGDLPTFTEEQLGDFSFYVANKAAIERAMRENRIIRTPRDWHPAEPTDKQQ
jgi:hypothetical protein